VLEDLGAGDALVALAEKGYVGVELLVIGLHGIAALLLGSDVVVALLRIGKIVARLLGIGAALLGGRWGPEGGCNRS
jgi:hypothetical protein